MPILGSLIKKAYELRQFPIDITVIDPVIEQNRVLKKLLLRAQNTSFGEYYDFNNIVSASDFLALFRKEGSHL